MAAGGGGGYILCTLLALSFAPISGVVIGCRIEKNEFVELFFGVSPWHWSYRYLVRLARSPEQGSSNRLGNGK